MRYLLNLQMLKIDDDGDGDNGDDDENGKDSSRAEGEPST